jgi:hypothetical protein
MKQRINLITLGVNHLESSMEFFKNAFGWHTKGIVGTEYENGAIVLFDLDNRITLSLYERKNLAWDSGLKQQPVSPTEFSLGHFVNSTEEVILIMAQAENAGAKIIKHPHDTFWGGFGGYFQDIDGHLWEIGYNPNWKVDE